MLQRMNQRQHALQVENRVCARHLIRQRRARLCRGQPDGRCRDHQTQVVGPRPAQRQRIRALHLEHRIQPAEQRRRGVICVPFDLGRRAQQDCIREPVLSPARTRASPATVAAALLPKPAAIGTSLVDLDEDRRGRSAGPCGDDVERPAPGRSPVHGRRALRHHQLRPAVVANVGDRGAKVELNSHAERVESTAQVGDRAGDPHLAAEGCAAGLK